jgi:hypothetical protein
MAERGRTCGDCANWKVRGSPCTYYDSIVRWVLNKRDPACEDFIANKKAKNKPKQHKICGLSDQGYFEAIYHESKPAFLVFQNNRFGVVEYLTIDDESFLPKEYPNEFPYEPYGYFEGELPSREEIFWKVRDEFDLFLDLESNWKDYLAACVLLSYQQEKVRTIPYVYFVGDNESGKTVALNLLNWLCYRPMLGVTIPSADTYGYLDDAESPGTILEDEAQGLYKDLDKAKIYKAGYKQGAVVPRTMITQNKRFIKYFRVFCFKACAAEEMPRVKGLIERFIFIAMAEGYPRKDWADFNKEDETRLRILRNILLKWRLASKELALSEIELPVKGRLKELWKPIIQIVSGLTVEKVLRSQIEALQKERLSEKTNTLEGHLVKIVCELFVSSQPVSFVDIWQALTSDLEGKLDDKKPNKMDTPEFGEVTKQKVGYRLREVLNGKKQRVRSSDGLCWVYGFDQNKLGRIAKKYGCGLVLKFSSDLTVTGSEAQKPENNLPNNQSLAENKADLESEKIEKSASDLANVAQVENSRTNAVFEEVASKAKSVCRLTMDYSFETCVICGAKGQGEWQVTQFDDSWGFLCGPCGLKLSEKLGKSE